MKALNAKEKLCLALDVDNLKEAVAIAKRLKDHVGIYKIGFQLFTIEGPRAVEKIQKTGGKVFLDLKFHDIPNTVANAARMATRLGVHMFNIHAIGGSEMMRAAQTAAAEEAYKRNLSTPIILAVTVLTSINDAILKEVNIKGTAKNNVILLSKLAQSAGIDGVVASPKEIELIRNACGKKFIILTPGIRPSWTIGKDDQKRVTTPGDAIRMGADYIVIGRPILNAENQQLAAEKVVDEIIEVSKR